MQDGFPRILSSLEVINFLERQRKRVRSEYGYKVTVPEVTTMINLQVTNNLPCCSKVYNLTTFLDEYDQFGYKFGFPRSTFCGEFNFYRVGRVGLDGLDRLGKFGATTRDPGELRQI